MLRKLRINYQLMLSALYPLKIECSCVFSQMLRKILIESESQRVFECLYYTWAALFSPRATGIKSS
jgi:hypothetical protein